MVLGEEFLEEALEILELVVLPYALLASNELVYPFVVLPPFGLLTFQLVPYSAQSGNIDFGLVAQFEYKSKEAEQLADNATPIRPLPIVFNGCNHHLIDVLLS